jgi:hypothetical protein
MVDMKRSTMALAVAGAAVVGLLSVAPSAAATPDLGRAGLMLTKADVPAGLRVTGGWEFTAEEATGLRPDLCTKNGKELTGALAPTMYQVELGERTAVGQHGLQQQVYEYATDAAAAKAFETLSARAKQCAGVTQESETTGGPTAAQRLTNGRTGVTVNGVKGVWIYNDYANTVAAKDWADGGYNVFFLAGRSIHALQYDIPDALPTTMKNRQQVNALGRDLALRWIAGQPTAQS